MFLTTVWSINDWLYTPGCYKFELTLSNQFLKDFFKLWILSKNGIRLFCIKFILICHHSQVYSKLFHFDFCIGVKIVGVQIQRVFINLWCFAKGSVFLKGSRSLLWCVVCNQGFDCVVNSQWLAEDWM